MLAILTQQEDDDDDNHLCIKCNATIVGLDNYVQHRKNQCGKRKHPFESSKTIEESFKANNQGADVFFQSLELQSSTKRPTVQQDPILPQTSTKNIPGVLTRRATAAIIATKDIYHTSDIVSNKRGEDWIGGHSLKVAECDDNQTKLIKAVANISGTVKKEHIDSPFILDDFKHGDDSNEDTDELEDMDIEYHPPSTGGKWKPSTTPTGGKWKSTYHSGRDSASHWTSVVTPEPDQIEEWEEEHTGGKWKPIAAPGIMKMNDLEDDDEDVYRPPPGHTKGKWIPGAKDNVRHDHRAQIMDATAMHKEGRPVQYWCGPCNRRLGSKHIYEKHLVSKLHLKRTLPEKDLECSRFLKRDKRTLKPSSYLDENFYLLPKKSAKKAKSELEGVKKRRKRRPVFIHCLVCRHKVKPFLLGKHLISHYHFRKGNLNDEFNKTQILDNIDKIVRQSPFQCSPCKFYANWQAEFMRHWRTEAHKENMENFIGRYWCSFCKFECTQYSEISEHLLGDEHQEVVAVINRSIPIIIRKKSIINCPDCSREFRYNIQLRRHYKQHCLNSKPSTASDEYQSKHKCNQCSFTSKTLIALARHVNKKHVSKLYYCSTCNLQFPNIIEAKNHRRSQNHRIKQKELRKEQGYEVGDLYKSCPHCNAPKFKNVIELKKHIQEEHKEMFNSCSRCGMKFAFPQEITWHMRSKACTFKTSLEPNCSSDQMWTCQFCPFVTASHAECLYHEVLHGEPTKDKQKYACPICQKLFSTYSLRFHIRSHTNERPHICDVCNASFFRKSNLVFHVKRMHTKTDDQKKSTDVKKVVAAKEAENDPKPFLCSDCGACFNKKFNLTQHQTLHAGRTHACTFEGCHYSARNPSELKFHLVMHSTSRPFKCDQCDYTAKTKIHLKRHQKIHAPDSNKKVQCPLCSFRASGPCRLVTHMRLHTGQKPFSCRFCTFTCNTLENLRKHVLSRNIHKDKSLYECEVCLAPTFKTNFAKEFKTHLMMAHPTTYHDQKSTTTYVADYLKGRSEEPSSISGVETNPKTIDMKFEENEPKTYLQTDDSILDEFPTGCYSVTETGILVPYLED